VWLPYPRAFDVLTKGDVPYEFVCYSPAYENGKGAYLFLQTPDSSNPNTPAIRNNSPTDKMIIGDENRTRIGIMREGDTHITRETVTMQSLPSLESGDTRAAWLHDAVLSPIQGNPREAIAKILALCRPVNGDKKLLHNLLDALTPLCPPNNMEKQRLFLFELYRQMPRTEVLYYGEMQRIHRIMAAYSWGGVDQALKMEAGLGVMKDIDAWDEGTHFTQMYGILPKYHLYMKYYGNQGGWRVGVGSEGDTTHDPANYKVSMWGGTDKYNALIDRLAEANKRTLYPAVKEAMAKKGEWITDVVRDDGLGGKIEYICASDGRVFAQTKDGLRTWIHDFALSGVPQQGKYFSGVSGVLKPIPDTNTHRYDQVLREWVPNAQNEPRDYQKPQPAGQTAQNR